MLHARDNSHCPADHGVVESTEMEMVLSIFVLQFCG